MEALCRVMRSITRDRLKTALTRVAAAAFWVGVWQIASALVRQEMLVASPAAVVSALARLSSDPSFYAAVGASLSRIAAGFALAAALGVGFAALSARFAFVRELLWPLMSLIKATPVASFVILALLWVTKARLSVFVSFLMVFPTVYTGVLQGLMSADRRLLEMAGVFGVSAWRRALRVYSPAAAPFFVSACTLGLGLCWKAGIAAEVIGLPSGTIGQALYTAKIYLETADLFAWTLVVVAASMLLERAFLWLARAAQASVERGTMRPRALNAAAERAVPAAGARVSLDGVSVSFDGVKVLDSLTFSADAGTVTCVTGASGAGKTTLLRALAGLAKPDAGRVVVPDGARFGVVFQEDRLLESLSAFDNVAFAVRGRPDERAVADELTALGLGGVMFQPVKTMSGGMKRRVALARALCADASVVLLDEPFKGLDDALKDAVIARVLERVKGKTLIVAAHDGREMDKLGGRIVRI